MALRPDHYRSLWTQGEVLLVEARLRRARGEDPTPALDEARAVAARGLAANRSSCQLWQIRAEVEDMTGHPGAAAAAARRGLAIKPDAIVLWVALARAERMQGEPVKAREALQKALALGPLWRPARAEAHAWAGPA
jgi:predicted Zn-dependent protease